MQKVKVDGTWVYPAHERCEPSCAPKCDRQLVEMYVPGRAMVDDATPQSDPDLFTVEEIKSEISYLLRLNKKYGTHELRVNAYLKLMQEIKKRRSRA